MTGRDCPATRWTPPRQDQWINVSVAQVLGLTARQCDVLCGIAQGQTNAAIARSLGQAEGTVKTHVARLLHQLGARDRAHAVAVAYDKGALRSAEVRRRAVRVVGRVAS